MKKGRRKKKGSSEGRERYFFEELKVAGSDTFGC
jgi:hypothetical protein